MTEKPTPPKPAKKITTGNSYTPPVSKLPPPPPKKEK